jgi:chemotaxis protein histidine kinase CheA
MAKKPTVTTLSSGFNSTDTLNTNFTSVRDAFDNTLSLDGSTPNAMEADLDLNGNNIIGASGLLINGTDYLADVTAAKAAALVAQAAAELAETNAETAETNAESAETAAASSATASATSATASAASAVDATNNGAAQVNLAANQVTLAETAKTAAELAETNAETAESNASTSATSATSSASTASTGASTATTKASEAATSATNAATSATESETAKDAAETARDAALAALDNFDDRYLGAKANAPTVDNDGNALIVGALYFNTGTDKLYIWNGTAWQVTTSGGASGDLISTNNLSDVTSAPTSRTNLGLVTVASTGSYSDLTGTPTLGTAAATASTDYATAAQGTLAASAQQPPSEGAFVNGDKTKLNGIEASADVTDTANVTSAGALMDSEVTNLAQVKAFSSADYATAAQGTLADSAVQPNDSPTFAGLTVDTDTLFVDATNNRLGIGTTTPESPLHVAGNGTIARLKGSGGDYHGLGVQCSDASGTATKSIFIDALNENAASVANMVGQVQSDGGSNWQWTTQTAGARTDRRQERMRIDSSGNVGIGKNNPATALDVNGTVSATTVDLGNWTVTESSGVLHFATGGVNKMKLEASGDLTVVGNITAYGTI